jgi:predicted MFS family arabinose efflux permease
MLHASEEDMAWTFFGQILFTMCGNILSGMMIKKYSPILLLLVSSALLSVCMAIMPFCSAIWALSFLLCFMGLNMGAVDNLDVSSSQLDANTGNYPNWINDMMLCLPSILLH